MPALFRRDMEVPSEEPRAGREAQSTRAAGGDVGRFFFGTFLLSAQKKGTHDLLTNGKAETPYQTGHEIGYR